MNTNEIQRIQNETLQRLIDSGRPAIKCAGPARVATGAPLAKYFDHTLLKPEATADRYIELCEEAQAHGTRSVCVPPDRVGLCAAELDGSDVEVCTVIGFPLGYHNSGAKVEEVRFTRDEGATEFDMVIPVGRHKDGDPAIVYDDVRAVVAAAGEMIVKVILETALLTDEEKVIAATAAVHAGGGILKTSTGFASTGATIEDLEMFRIIAGENRGVKAAGGIRDLAFARACIDAGADRLGASATVAILGEAAGVNPASGSSGDGY